MGVTQDTPLAIPPEPMPISHSIISAPLDPGFKPAILFNREYLSALCASGKGVPLILGLERENGLISRFETQVSPTADPTTLFYVERLVKFLIWSRGGWKLHFGGPKSIGEAIKKTYSSRGARKFDCKMMALAYGKNFEVHLTTAAKVPAAKDMEVPAGGHLAGCRIGFDLGASDYKVSAVIDGEAVFTAETPWDPKNQSNPEYHYHHISAALHRAAACMPRVDAIGGSSAGIIVDNEIRVASLLRSIPKKLRHRRRRLQTNRQGMECPARRHERWRCHRSRWCDVAETKRHVRCRHGFERGRRLHGQTRSHPWLAQRARLRSRRLQHPSTRR